MIPETSEVKTKRSMSVIFGIGMLLLSIGILSALIYPQRELLISQKWDIHWNAVWFTFGIFTIALLVVALIWSWIMNVTGSKLPLLMHLRIYLVSHLARRLPGTVWYVASRVVLYGQEGIRTRPVVASGVELLVMMVSGIIISLVFATSIITNYGVGLGWFAVLSIVGIGLLHPKTIRVLLKKTKVEFPQSIQMLQVVQWITAYIVVWVLGGLVLFGVTNIVFDIDWMFLPYLIGCWSLVGVVSTSLFFLPSNLGVTEVGLSLLLSRIVPSPIAVVIALLVRLLLIAFEIFWAGIVFVLERRRSIISL